MVIKTRIEKWNWKQGINRENQQKQKLVLGKDKQN